MAEASAGAAKATVSGEEEADDSVMASWLVVDEETASELSNLLDLFEASPPPMKVRFIDDPYSTAVVFQSSTAYVTINGNEESCGSSFSDSDSSVMASVDLGGGRRRSGVAWGFDCAEARQWWGEMNVEEAGDEFLEFFADGSGCDCEAVDGGDAMRAEFLGEGSGQL